MYFLLLLSTKIGISLKELLDMDKELIDYYKQYFDMVEADKLEEDLETSTSNSVNANSQSNKQLQQLFY